MKVAFVSLFLIVFIYIGSGFIGKENLFYIPEGFPKPVYDFKNNPVTTAGFALGRHLFYDPTLSRDSSIACDNCHQPFAAFANIEHQVSHGMDGCLGTRNAPPLINLAWQKSFLLDGGIAHIEMAPLNALLDSCEMANNLDTIVIRLRKDKNYPKMFAAAFGTDKINSQKILPALAQFTSMLISANSKYDKHIRHEAGGEYSQMEEEGYQLFKQCCNTCHREPLFTDYSFRNNGLDSISTDLGRAHITEKESDKGLFRVPTLRNIVLTYPYMHDGRFPMLYHALAHYARGVKKNPNLDKSLQINGKLGFPLTDRDLMKLEIFLKTLTDTSFTKNKLFDKPADIYYANQVYF